MLSLVCISCRSGVENGDETAECNFLGHIGGNISKHSALLVWHIGEGQTHIHEVNASVHLLQARNNVGLQDGVIHQLSNLRKTPQTELLEMRT